MGGNSIERSEYSYYSYYSGDYPSETTVDPSETTEDYVDSTETPVDPPETTEYYDDYTEFPVTRLPDTTATGAGAVPCSP